MFLAEVSPDQAAGYNPVLNEEHREWRWFPAAEAAALPNLHPVVAALFSPALRSQAGPHTATRYRSLLIGCMVGMKFAKACGLVPHMGSMLKHLILLP